MCSVCTSTLCCRHVRFDERISCLCTHYCATAGRVPVYLVTAVLSISRKQNSVCVPTRGRGELSGKELNPTSPRKSLLRWYSFVSESLDRIDPRRNKRIQSCVNRGTQLRSTSHNLPPSPAPCQTASVCLTRAHKPELSDKAYPVISLRRLLACSLRLLGRAILARCSHQELHGKKIKITPAEMQFLQISHPSVWTLSFTFLSPSGHLLHISVTHWALHMALIMQRAPRQPRTPNKTFHMRSSALITVDINCLFT